MGTIHVTRTFMPPFEEYTQYLDQIWDSRQLTNQGPLLREFQKNVKKYLEVGDFQFVSNGTIALQLALHGLGIKSGEIITTPFSYVATTSSILWERCVPVFVDIEPDTYCIDPSKIEAAITPNTKAIMAVHVFGNPCDIDAINEIAKKYDLKVIYDGAHAFGVRFKERSIFDYGDISTCSFHATKLFHTIEGGGVFVKDSDISLKIELAKRFGHNNDEYLSLGINAKANEFQAAMGLVNLNYVDEVIAARKEIFDLYNTYLDRRLKRPIVKNGVVPNYSYYPFVFDSEEELKETLTQLKKRDIHPRRYFYPSLNTLSYVQYDYSCPVSEDIARRIVCLPLYPGLEEKDIKLISEIINA